MSNKEGVLLLASIYIAPHVPKPIGWFWSVFLILLAIFDPWEWL
jgi:hypothetical protein